jgi:hypothetical protein
MATLRRWSTSASGNATVTGGVNTINFAEGQTPGSVNNSAREMMAQVRSIYTPSEWGWVEHSATVSVASQTSFKLGGNQTTNWTAGRRWRLKSGSTTRYGSVVSSSFTAETTITVTVDSGSLSASHSLAALSPIDVTANPIPTLRVDSSGNVGIGAAPNYALDVIKTGTVQARFGNTSGTGTGGAVILSTSATQGIFGGGWDYNGTNFVARAAQAGMFLTGSGGLQISYDTGLTAGNTFTPTARLQIDSSGNILNISSGGLGYGTGSGGTVTQLTSRTTSVTLNKTNGAVTLFTAAGVSSPTSFVVTNSTVAATDTVVVSVKSATNTYRAYVVSVNAGSFTITFESVAGAASDAPVFNFAIIKAVTS